MRIYHKLRFQIRPLLFIGFLFLNSSYAFTNNLWCWDLEFNFEGIHWSPQIVPGFILKMDIKNHSFIQENIRKSYQDEIPIKSLDQQAYFNLYLTNIKMSLQEVFDPWFRSGLASKNLREVLKAQHKLLIAGNLDSKYRGYMGGRPSESPIEPGIMKFEQIMGQLQTARLVLRGFGVRDIQLEGPFPDRVWIQGVAEALQRRGLNPDDMGHPFVKDAFPKNYSDNLGRVLHIYPRFYAHIQKELYLERMAFVLGHIENCLLRPYPNTPTYNVMALIAEYYHVGINAHLFDRGNNSLLMSQVNYFLHYFGFNGIRHEYWDYVALINHSQDFEKIFINAIRAANPNKF